MGLITKWYLKYRTILWIHERKKKNIWKIEQIIVKKGFHNFGQELRERQSYDLFFFHEGIIITIKVSQVEATKEKIDFRGKIEKSNRNKNNNYYCMKRAWNRCNMEWALIGIHLVPVQHHRWMAVSDWNPWIAQSIDMNIIKREHISRSWNSIIIIIILLHARNVNQAKYEQNHLSEQHDVWSMGAKERRYFNYSNRKLKWKVIIIYVIMFCELNWAEDNEPHAFAINWIKCLWMKWIKVKSERNGNEIETTYDTKDMGNKQNACENIPNSKTILKIIV